MVGLEKEQTEKEREREREREREGESVCVYACMYVHEYVCMHASDCVRVCYSCTAFGGITGGEVNRADALALRSRSG
jgi:hypothetical protein